MTPAKFRYGIYARDGEKLGEASHSEIGQALRQATALLADQYVQAGISPAPFDADPPFDIAPIKDGEADNGPPAPRLVAKPAAPAPRPRHRS